MNKLVNTRLLYLILLVAIILSTLSAATQYNNSQFTTDSASISSSHNNISNSQFITTPSLDSIAGITNSSQYTLCIGVECTIPICGNNILERGELCDSGNLNSQSCTTKGFSAGTLKCSSDCLSYDTSSCTVSTPQQGGSSGGGESVSGGSESSQEPEEEIQEETTTTLQESIPEEESPINIIDTARELAEKSIKVLSAVEKVSKGLYILAIIGVITASALTIYLIVRLLAIIISSIISKISRIKEIKNIIQQKQIRKHETRKMLLENYIKNNIKQGYKPSEISSVLLNNGWEHKEIEHALKSILKEKMQASGES